MPALSEEEMINQAIATLLERWKGSAPEQQNSLRLEILRMKITRIRLSMGNAQQAEDFDGIYTAWRRYGTMTYYMNIGYGDCVAVSKDGTMTVQPSSLLGRTSPGHTTSIFRRSSTAQQRRLLQCRLCIAGCVKKSAAKNAMLDVWMQISNRSLFLCKQKRPKSPTLYQLQWRKI